MILVFAAGACTSDHGPKTQPAHHAPPLAVTNMTGNRPHHMRNCPSGVPGSATSATATLDGVDLIITADSPTARDKIVALAAKQAGVISRNPFAPEHSGLRGGPATIGFCPIIHANTAVSYEILPHGVIVHVTTPAANVKALQDATLTRVGALRETTS